MLLNKIEKIITKYLINQASFTELEALELWLLEKENEQIFIEFIKTNYLIDSSLKKFNTSLSSKKLIAFINKEKKTLRLRRVGNYLKYAAVFIGVLMVGYFYNLDKGPNTKTPVVVGRIQTGTDRATLTLENGTIVSLEKGVSFNNKNAKSNGEKLIYLNSTNKEKTKIAYNYLTIPRGGQFYLKLNDGTQVWLNSESQLKYPVSFTKGKTRIVELVYGEAFFDVSPSTNHEGSLFKVHNREQDIQVLGTTFNIKAYKDESSIYTTLVEGKVVVNYKNIQKKLTPNDQLILNLETKTTTLQKVDVYNEIYWKDGIFSFEEKSLFEIMKVLSRWYDVKVVFKNQKIQEEEFIGVLSKNQNIEDILKSIKNFGLVKNYTIKENQIILE
jgi:hypothetical protein